MENQDSHQSQQHTEKKSHRKGFGVAASPFNGVKLELGFAFVIGIILWIAVDFITPSVGKQLMILASYGLVAAIWLVARTRQVIKHLSSKPETH